MTVNKPEDPLHGVAQAALRLGDIVRMNERSPYFSDWRDATMKVVSLRIDPHGNEWVSVIEGDQRHRGNGVYDGETTDIEADHLSLVSSTDGATPPSVALNAGETVAIRRSWLEHVIKTLQGPLPRGHIGDVVFLLRDQLQDILDRPQPGGAVAGTDQAHTETTGE